MAHAQDPSRGFSIPEEPPSHSRSPPFPRKIDFRTPKRGDEIDVRIQRLSSKRGGVKSHRIHNIETRTPNKSSHEAPGTPSWELGDDNSSVNSLRSVLVTPKRKAQPALPSSLNKTAHKIQALQQKCEELKTKMKPKLNLRNMNLADNPTPAPTSLTNSKSSQNPSHEEPAASSTEMKASQKGENEVIESKDNKMAAMSVKLQRKQIQQELPHPKPPSEKTVAEKMVAESSSIKKKARQQRTLSEIETLRKEMKLNFEQISEREQRLVKQKEAIEALQQSKSHPVVDSLINAILGKSKMEEEHTLNLREITRKQDSKSTQELYVPDENFDETETLAEEEISYDTSRVPGRQVHGLNATILSLTDQLNQYAHMLKSKEDEITILESRLENCRSEIESSNWATKQKSEEVALLQGKLGKQDREVLKLQNIVSGLRHTMRRKGKLLKKYGNVELECNDLRGSIVELQNTNSRLRDSIKRNEEFLEKYPQIELERNNLHDKVVRLGSEVQMRRKEISDLNMNLLQNETEKQAQARSAASFKQKAADLEAELKTAVRKLKDSVHLKFKILRVSEELKISLEKVEALTAQVEIERKMISEQAVELGKKDDEIGRKAKVITNLTNIQEDLESQLRSEKKIKEVQQEKCERLTEDLIVLKEDLKQRAAAASATARVYSDTKKQLEDLNRKFQVSVETNLKDREGFERNMSLSKQEITDLKLQIQQLLDTDERKRVEVSDLNEKNTKLESEIKSLLKDRESFERNMSLSKQEITDLKLQIQQLLDTDERKRVEVSDLNEKNTKLESEIKSLLKDRESFERNMSLSKQEIADLNLQIQQLLDTDERKRVEVSDLNEKNTKLESEITALRISEENLQRNVRAQRTQLDEKLNTIASNLKKYESSIIAKNRIAAELGKLRSEHKTLKENFDAQRRQVEIATAGARASRERTSQFIRKISIHCGKEIEIGDSIKESVEQACQFVKALKMERDSSFQKITKANSEKRKLQHEYKESLQTERDALKHQKANFETLKCKYDSAIKNQADISSEVDTYRTRMENAEKEVGTLQEQLRESSQQLHRLQSEYDKQVDSIKNLGESKEHLVLQLKTESDNVAKERKKREDLVRDVAALENRIRQQDVEANATANEHSKSLRQIEKLDRKLHISLETNLKDRENFEKSMSELKSKVSTLKTQRQEVDYLNKRQKLAIQDIMERHTRLESENEDLKTVEKKLKEEIQTLKAKLENKSNVLAAKVEKYEQIVEANKQVELKLEKLQSERTSLNETIDSLRCQVEDSAAETRALMNQTKKFTENVTSLCGKQFKDGDTLSDSLEQTCKLVRALRMEQKLTSQKHSQLLLERKKIDQEYKKALQLEREALVCEKEKCGALELKLESIAKQRVDDSAKAQTYKTHAEVADREVESLQERLSEKSEEFKSLKSEFQEKVDAIGKLVASRDSLASQLQRETDKFEIAQEKCNRLAKDLVATKQELKLKDAVSKGKSETHKQLELLERKLKISMETNLQDCEKFEQNMAALKAEISELKSQNENLGETQESQRLEILNLQNANSKLETENGKLIDSRNEINVQLEDRTKTLAANIEKYETVLLAKKQVDVQVTKLKNEHKSLMEKIDTLTEKISTTSSQYEAQITALKAKSGEIERMRRASSLMKLQMKSDINGTEKVKEKLERVQQEHQAATEQLEVMAASNKKLLKQVQILESKKSQEENVMLKDTVEAEARDAEIQERLEMQRNAISKFQKGISVLETHFEPTKLRIDNKVVAVERRLKGLSQSMINLSKWLRISASAKDRLQGMLHKVSQNAKELQSSIGKQKERILELETNLEDSQHSYQLCSEELQHIKLENERQKSSIRVMKDRMFKGKKLSAQVFESKKREFTQQISDLKRKCRELNSSLEASGKREAGLRRRAQAHVKCAEEAQEMAKNAEDRSTRERQRLETDIEALEAENERLRKEMLSRERGIQAQVNRAKAATERASEAEKKRAQKQIDSLHRRYDNLYAKFEEEVRYLENLKQELLEKDLRIAEMQKDLNSMPKKGQNSTHKDTSIFKERAARLEQELEQLKRQKEQLLSEGFHTSDKSADYDEGKMSEEAAVQLAVAQAAVASISSKYNESQSLLKNVAQKLQQAQHRLRVVEEELQQLREQKRHLQSAIVEAQLRTSKAVRELTTAREQLQKKEANVENLTNALREKSLAANEIDRQEAEIKDLKKTCLEWESRLESMQEEKYSLERKLSEVEENLKRRHSKEEGLEQRIATLQNDLAMLQSQLHAERTKATENEEFRAKMESKLIAAEEKARELKTHVSDLEEKLQKEQNSGNQLRRDLEKVGRDHEAAQKRFTNLLCMRRFRDSDAQNDRTNTSLSSSATFR